LDLLAGVADTLALVRLGRTERADIRGDLADLLDVRALDDDLGLRGRFDRDAFGRDVNHRMRETQREIEVLALSLGAITDADGLELALVTLAHALHDVRQMRARGARDHVGLARLARLLDLQNVAVLHDLHVTAVDRQAHRALAALHGHGLGADRRAYALRQRNRLFGYSRHVFASS